MKRPQIASAHVIALAFGVAACNSDLARPELPTESAAEASRGAGLHDGPYEFSAAVFDISATPDGSILVAQNTTIREIRKGGVGDIIEIPTIPGSPINGLEAIGRRSFFATSGGLDLAAGGRLWRVSQGNARAVADIGAFEREHDPDASEGPQWKDPRCEAVDGFSAGPQTNPFHLTALSGSEALVADAAGNALLSAKSNGEIDWIAVFTPPVGENDDWIVRFELDDGTDCFVQPVPTSVAIGPDGAIYVGELTGSTLDPVTFASAADPQGLSRVWRIEPGARNVVCPSAACREAVSGLTAVIDIAFGPDGRLYVVEFDENGWLAPFTNNVAGGTINRCNVDTGACAVVEAGLTLPGAITFDKWGSLWVLENGIGAPTVRRVEVL